jgi:hypothetical protein
MAITEQHKRQRVKNFALAGFLITLVVLFFFITLVKMGGAA